MKKQLIITAITTALVLGLGATTAAVARDGLTQRQEQLCNLVTKAGYKIMQARQAGYAKAILLQEAHIDNTAVGMLAFSMINNAYKVPRYIEPERQEQASQDFANRSGATCVAQFQ